MVRIQHFPGKHEISTWKVKGVGDLMRSEPVTEAPVNGRCNYDCPKVTVSLLGKVSFLHEMRNDLTTVVEKDLVK